MEKSYYAIIPATVRYDQDLPPNAKLLYGEITALTNEKGYCWANNEYFSRLYGATKRSIQNWMEALKKGGYIDIEMEYREGKQFRYITIDNIHPMKKISSPHENNFTPPMKKNSPIIIQDNNTNNKKKVSKDENYNSLIESYTNNNDLKQALVDFIKMRKLIKKPLTNRALTNIFSKLDKLNPNDDIKIKILDQSITNSWQSIYALKIEQQEEAKAKGWKVKEWD